MWVTDLAVSISSIFCATHCPKTRIATTKEQSAKGVGWVGFEINKKTDQVTRWCNKTRDNLARVFSLHQPFRCCSFRPQKLILCLSIKWCFCTKKDECPRDPDRRMSIPSCGWWPSKNGCQEFIKQNIKVLTRVFFKQHPSTGKSDPSDKFLSGFEIYSKVKICVAFSQLDLILTKWCSFPIE